MSADVFLISTLFRLAASSLLSLQLSGFLFLQTLFGFPFSRSSGFRSHALTWKVGRLNATLSSPRVTVPGLAVTSCLRSDKFFMHPSWQEPASQSASRLLPQPGQRRWRRFMLSSKMAARQPTDTTALWNLNSSAHKRLHYYNVSTYLQTNSLLRVYFPCLPLTWLSAQALPLFL